MTTAAPPRHTDGRQLTLLVLGVMTAAAGLSVAGNYFAQPLLGLLRSELDMSTGTAGLTVAAAQVGYAVGLALLVPLGDRYPRRGLATLLLAATGVLLFLAGTAPSGPVLLMATGLAAVTSVGAQVVVPFAAELSSSDHRARNVGIVMAGVISGGILGRAFSGVVADVAGWRTVYWVTAGLLLVTAYAVHRLLPDVRPNNDAVRLTALLRSTAMLLAELPALRRPVAVAALTMASYSVHMVTFTLLLVEQPYEWSPARIGLVGLVGVVGPLSMPFAGRLVDRGHKRAVMAAGVLSVAAGWLVFLPAQSGQVAWLVAGLVLINTGQTAMLNAAQNTSYDLRPEARGRINAVFMTLFFAGGAAGGAAAPFIWLAAGWTGACVLGAAIASVAALVAVSQARTR